MNPRPARPSRRLAAAASVTALSVCTLFLAGCASAGGPSGNTASSGTSGGSSDDGDLTPVTIALDWTPNTNHSGIYLAQERGYFEDAGLEVSIVEPGDVGGLDLLATGDAQFAVSFADALAPAVSQGVDAVSVAAVIEHNTSSLLFDKSSGITRPADLADHVYGTYGGALELQMVESLIECDGGDPSTLSTAPLATEDIRVGLEQHQFDFAWVFDAWDTVRLRDVDKMDVGTFAFVDYDQCIPDWYTPVIATSNAYLEESPDDAKGFVEALAHGYADAMTDPAAAADAIMAASPEQDPELVELSAEYLSTRYAPSPEQWGAQEAPMWDDFVGFLESHDLEGGDVDASTLWTTEVLGR